MRHVIGVFADPEAAERAGRELRAARGPTLTADDVGAEAPGQAYGHDVGAQLIDAVNSGSSTVTVTVETAADAERIARSLRGFGAHQIKTTTA